MNFGNKVKLKYQQDSPFPNVIEELRNVTEIHFNYPSVVARQVAFESDIHETGKTVFVSHIQEFETTLEVEKAEAF